MSKNHMIIGLGGTGGKVIRDFRKLFYQEFRERVPSDLEVGYLYVDSSGTLMKRDHPEWRTLGASVQLPQASQLQITGDDLVARLDNIEQYPALRPWIGERRMWNNILDGMVGDAVGGQKRRLGRFLFACKAKEFDERISTLVRGMQASSNQQAVTFHVVSGLAGGTGSGSIVDIVSQLRKNFPGDDYRILVHVLLPEENNNKAWDTGNYHANGYAALLELNALSVQAYAPYDVNGQGRRVSNQVAFNGCYLVTNQNANGLIVDVATAVPEIMADFLFQRIVVSRTVQWEELYRAENAENGDGTPESMDVSPELAGKVSTRLRSKRFLSYGIKRVAIPEEEIREYLALSYARQAALQLRANNWQDGIGFVEEPRNQDFVQVVRQSDVEENWRLAEEYLTLAKAVLPSDDPNRRWKNLDEEWQSFMPALKERIRTERKREQWLDGLESFCRERFDQNFRNMGVVEFYRSKGRARKEMAAEIRGLVERQLFGEWENGTRSMAEVGALVAALIERTQERMSRIDDRVGQLRAFEEERQAGVDATRAEWVTTGILGSMFGKLDKIFDAHALLLTDLFAVRTKIEGSLFAKQLMAEVVVALQDLQASVDKAISQINTVLRDLEAGIGSRVTEAGSEDIRSHLIRYFDPAQVKKVTQTLVTDEEEQRKQTAKVRRGLLERMGEARSFTHFNSRFTAWEMREALEKSCDDNARVAHETLVTDVRERILNVSIIDKLKEEYGSDRERLYGYVADLVNAAGRFIKFDSLEMQKVGSTISRRVTASESLTVFLPKAPQHSEFMELLKDAFRSATTTQVHFCTSEGRSNEITLVALVNLFPLRTVAPVKFLKSRYDDRLDGASGEQARLELHTEGDGSDFPSLYAPNMEETLARVLPYLLIARAMDIIVEQRNPATGKPECQLVTKDADGFPQVTVLGATMTDTLEKVGVEPAFIIEAEVRKRLGEHAFQHVDARVALKDPIRAVVEGVQAAASNNLTDPRYVRAREGARSAFALLDEGVPA